MARSLPDRLDALRAKRARVEEQRKRVEEEFEQLIQPLKRKLVGVADAAADAFVREHIDEMDKLSLSRAEQKALEDRLFEVYAETLANNAGSESGPVQASEKTPDVAPVAPTSTDDLDQSLPDGLSR